MSPAAPATGWVPPLPASLRPGGRYAAWAPAPPAYLVCDVDGTLLGPSAQPTDAVRRAVRAATAQGLRVGLATGRMRQATATLRRRLRAPGPHLFSNGAEVRVGSRRVAGWPLDAGQVRDLLALIEPFDDGYAEVYTSAGYLVSRMDERARPHWELLGRPPAGVVGNGASIPRRAVKVVLVAFEEAAAAPLVAGVQALGLVAGPSGSPLTPGLRYVNVTHPDTDKGRALAHAAVAAGVELAATVAIGDAPNDLPLLWAAGTAVAMGQAPPEVTAAAHLVAPSVDEDGVAAVIEALLAWRARPAPTLG